MSKTEEFIRENTRNCGNVCSYNSMECEIPWLTPDDARKAVEIAEKDVIEKVCVLLEDKISENCYGNNLDFIVGTIYNIDFLDIEGLIDDIKQAIKDENVR